MKINFSSEYNKYRNTLESVKNADKEGVRKAEKENGANAAAENTDKVTLSSEAASYAEISKLTASLSAEVHNLGNAERIAELAKRVQSGNYHVASGDIADAILGNKRE